MRKQPNPRELRVGDRIRIIRLPGEGVPGYYLHPDTRRVFKKLMARGRSVRIARIDGQGVTWFACRFRLKSGHWEWHELSVCELDNNWVRVVPHGEKSSS